MIALRFAAAMVACASLPALATEGGGTSRGLGIDTILSGVLPPPGWIAKLVIGGYEASRTLDGSGRPRVGVSDFGVKVHATALHLQYVWPDAKVLGAGVMTTVATPWLEGDIAFDAATPGGPVRVSGSTSAAGDLYLAPALLGWRGASFHQIAGIYLSLPTGASSPARPINPGRGYASILPSYAFTWFPAQDVEVSVGAYYLYNRTNPDTRYRSGQEMTADYGLGYHVAPMWQVGISGYLHQQVTDDERDGQRVADGNRGRVAAIGPFVRFHGRGWGVVLKWQAERLVENRAAGDRVILQLAMKL